MELRISREKSSAQRFHASACTFASSAAARWSCSSNVNGASSNSCAAAAPWAKAAATSVAVMRRCMNVLSLLSDEADGVRLAIRGVEHLGAHRLAGGLGRNGQAPVGQQRARKFGL